MIKKIIKYILSPLKNYILNISVQHNLDIGATLQREANKQTAAYVRKYMSDTDSVTTNFALLDKALREADISSGRLVCEFGVFSGRSINYIALNTDTPIFGFDSFEGLPERWRDGFGQGYFKVNKLPKVKSNVKLIKGWFNETLPEFIKSNEGIVGFLHIDCDLYSSTKCIFDHLGPRIKKGTVIVFDEYFNYPDWENGEIKAFKEFISDYELSYKYIGFNRMHEQVAVVIL